MKSAWWFVVAGIVAIGGIVGAVLDLVPRLSGIDSRLTQVMMPGSTVLELKEVGSYTIYRESRADGLRLALTAPDGSAVPLQVSSGTSTYSIGERNGTSIFTFTVKQPGSYRLTGTLAGGRGDLKIMLAVEHGMMAEMFRMVMRTMAIAFSGFAIAGIIVGLTIWQRTKARS